VSAVLLSVLCLYGLGVRRPPADARYLARVASAIDAIPYRIGPLVGTDATPTPAAVRLLRPNRILERRYADPRTGHALTLLLVHCADVHDMLGHYPPVCYPAHGWIAGPASTTDIAMGEVGGGGSPCEAAIYEFSRSGDEIEQRMTVMSFFILPGPDGGLIAADMDALARAARSPGAAGLGAAQVQFITPGPLSTVPGDGLAELVLHAIEPSIRTIAAGPQP
jgi:hypothetical protein